MEVVVRAVQARRRQNLRAGDALVLEVVDRVADPLPVHAIPVIDFVQENRNQAGLPVVAMDDVRPLVGLQHELHGRFAEERKAHHIIVLAVETPASIKSLIGVRINEETLPAMNKAEPDAAGNRTAEPRNPELFPYFVKPPDFVIPHAVILGENDFDGIAADLQLAAETENDISQPSDLRDGGHF